MIYHKTERSSLSFPCSWVKRVPLSVLSNPPPYLTAVKSVLPHDYKGLDSNNIWKCSVVDRSLRVMRQNLSASEGLLKVLR